MRFLIAAVVSTLCVAACNGDDATSSSAAPDAATEVTPDAAIDVVADDADANVPSDAKPYSICVGNEQHYCQADGSCQLAATCPYLCANGACTGICLPGTQQCFDGRISQICTDSAGWNAGGAACESLGDAGGDVSVGDAPSADDISRSDGDHGIDAVAELVTTLNAGDAGCVPGARRCAGLQPEICAADGEWTIGSPLCLVGCAAGVCAVDCVPGSLQCNGNQPQTCTESGALVNVGDPCQWGCIGLGTCLDGGADAATD